MRSREHVGELLGSLPTPTGARSLNAHWPKIPATWPQPRASWAWIEGISIGWSGDWDWRKDADSGAERRNKTQRTQRTQRRLKMKGVGSKIWRTPFLCDLCVLCVFLVLQRPHREVHTQAAVAERVDRQRLPPGAGCQGCHELRIRAQDSGPPAAVVRKQGLPEPASKP